MYLLDFKKFFPHIKLFKRRESYLFVIYTIKNNSIIQKAKKLILLKLFYPLNAKQRKLSAKDHLLIF